MTQTLHPSAPPREPGTREGKLESGGGWGVEEAVLLEFRVFGQGQEHVGGSAWGITPGEGDPRLQPQCHKPGSTKSSQHLEWISRDTGGPCWHAALPLYFSLQIEKQNRHQGYIYITVFKLHFLLPSAAHDKFQVFSNKKKKKRRGRSGKQGWVCVCVSLKACSLFGAETIFFSLHVKGDVKTCSRWRSHCFKMFWYFACHVYVRICIKSL